MQEKFRWAPKVGGALLTGALLFSSDSGVSSQSFHQVKAIGEESISQTIEVTPQINVNVENLVKEPPKCSILFADGLGGNGHKSRDFFAPIAKTADSLGVPYQSVVPKDPYDPEKGDWTNKFRKQLEKEVQDGKQVTLIGYSMGAREVLELIAELIDPQHESYNPELLKHINGVFLVGARDNDAKNSTNHPELRNYASHYVANPADRNSQANITPEIIDKIKLEFSSKTVIFGEPGDTVTPEIQGKQLASRIGASFVSIDVKNSDGTPDNHFGLMEAGIPIAQNLETKILDISCPKP